MEQEEIIFTCHAQEQAEKRDIEQKRIIKAMLQGKVIRQGHTDNRRVVIHDGLAVIEEDGLIITAYPSRYKKIVKAKRQEKKRNKINHSKGTYK